MDKRNTIKTDSVAVSKASKRKVIQMRRENAVRAARVEPPSSMLLADWIALTSRGGGAVPVPSPVRVPPVILPLPRPIIRRIENEDVKAPASLSPGAEICPNCKLANITLAEPATVCTLCMIRLCSKCKQQGKIMPLEGFIPSGISPTCFKNNAFEQDILKKYLEEQKISVADIHKWGIEKAEEEKWKFKNCKIYNNIL